MNENSHRNSKKNMPQEPAVLGLIHDCKAVDAQFYPSRDIPYNMVDYSRLTPEGVRITSNLPIEKDTRIGFKAYDPGAEKLRSYRALVAYSEPISDTADSFTHDLKFVEKDESASNAPVSQSGNGSDLDFLMQIRNFENIPPHVLLHLITCLHRRNFDQGSIYISRAIPANRFSSSSRVSAP